MNNKPVMNILRFKRAMSTKPLLKFDIFKPGVTSGKPSIKHHTSTNHRTSESPDSSYTPKETSVPIILLHGLLGNKRNNKTAATKLCSLLNTTVITPDFRNHGQSFHSNEPMTHDLLAEDIHNLYNHLTSTNELNTDKVVVIGHSLGGKVAMHFGLKYPHLTKGITSVDNVPYDNPRISLPEFQRFKDSLVFLQEKIVGNESFQKMKDVDKALQEVEKDPNFRLFVLSNLVKVTNTNGEGHHYDCRVPIKTIVESMPEFSQFNLDPSLQKPCKSPLLIIKAIRSMFTAEMDKPENVDKITALFPSFHRVDIDCGHWVISERCDEFVHAVVKWYRAEI